MVITATGGGGKRPDGVRVVPMTASGPENPRGPSSRLDLLGLNIVCAVRVTVVEKPAHVFDRSVEWEALVDFAADGPPGQMRLGLVYGRRRQGKSLLTGDLAEAVGGFRWEAIETEVEDNLTEISRAWAAHIGAPGASRFDSWDDALRTILSAPGRPNLVVLDEIQRVIVKLPTFPSLLQRIIGPPGLGDQTAHTRLLLCGSAFGEMRKLIDGRAALRGRAMLDLVIRPFDFRVAAAYWGLTANPAAALRLHSFIGGTPAYKALAGTDQPTDGDVDGWVQRRLLTQHSSLFREGRIVVQEDAQLGDRQLYWGLISAIASGARRWGDLVDVLGLGPGALQHAVNVVIDAGWVEKIGDPLRKNRAVYEITEPVVRFHRIVVERNEARLQRGQAKAVWTDVRPLVASRISAPHAEHLAREWILGYADSATLGGVVNEVGPSEVAGVGQVDLVGVAATSVGGRRPVFVAEVKATTGRVGTDVLRRLDAVAAKVDPTVMRVIVSINGFTTDLERAVAKRPDVQLVDVHRLYHGS